MHRAKVFKLSREGATAAEEVEEEAEGDATAAGAASRLRLPIADKCNPAQFVRYLQNLLTDPGMRHPREYQELLWAVSNLIERIYKYRDTGSLIYALLSHFPQRHDGRDRNCARYS